MLKFSRDKYKFQQLGLINGFSDLGGAVKLWESFKYKIIMFSFYFFPFLIELKSAFTFDISYLILLNIYIENYDLETYNVIISQLCLINELIDYSYFGEISSRTWGRIT